MSSIKILLQWKENSDARVLAEIKGFTALAVKSPEASNMAAGPAPRQLNTAEIPARGAALTPPCPCAEQMAG